MSIVMPRTLSFPIAEMLNTPILFVVLCGTTPDISLSSISNSGLDSTTSLVMLIDSSAVRSALDHSIFPRINTVCGVVPGSKLMLKS